MTATIRVNNKVGIIGEISGVTSYGRPTTEKESMRSWIDSNPDKPISEYHRNFSYVHVTDKAPEDIAYLTEPLIVDGSPVGNKYRFTQPDKNSQEFLELLNTGEIYRAWKDVSVFVVENS